MSVKPVVALVGRPNVGKSTLFNRLTRTRDALVADLPGVTRDRQYGTAEIDGRAFIVVDTGGLSGDEAGLDSLMAEQTRQAVEEADVVLFMVDGRDGVLPADEQIAGQLRRLGKPVRLVVNKIDGLDPDAVIADFYGLGLGEPAPIAAAQGRGVAALLDGLEGVLPSAAGQGPEDEMALGTRVAVVGRPNVGKSTLVNRLLGEERMVAFDEAGTTRDAVEIPFERDGRPYTLVDTAGVRRRARVRQGVEKFSVVKTLQAIERAHVVVMVIDAREGVTEQDLHLLGHVIESGRALVVAVNKWDHMDADQRDATRRGLDRRMAFARFAETHFISALHGTGVGLLMEAVDRAHAAATRKISTGVLTRALVEAVEAHQPPLVRGRRIKLRYAHQGGSNPPRIVVHGKQTGRLPGAYRRYLENHFRRTFDLQGTPVRLEFRTDENPYAGKR